jgi:hypothetical protein
VLSVITPKTTVRINIPSISSSITAVIRVEPTFESTMFYELSVAAITLVPLGAKTAPRRLEACQGQNSASPIPYPNITERITPMVVSRKALLPTFQKAVASNSKPVTNRIRIEPKTASMLITVKSVTSPSPPGPPMKRPTKIAPITSGSLNE